MPGPRLGVRPPPGRRSADRALPYALSRRPVWCGQRALGDRRPQQGLCVPSIPQSLLPLDRRQGATCAGPPPVLAAGRVRPKAAPAPPLTAGAAARAHALSSPSEAQMSLTASTGPLTGDAGATGIISVSVRPRLLQASVTSAQASASRPTAPDGTHHAPLVWGARTVGANRTMRSCGRR